MVDSPMRGYRCKRISSNDRYGGPAVRTRQRGKKRKGSNGRPILYWKFGSNGLSCGKVVMSQFTGQLSVPDRQPFVELPRWSYELFMTRGNSQNQRPNVYCSKSYKTTFNGINLKPQGIGFRLMGLFCGKVYDVRNEELLLGLGLYGLILHQYGDTHYCNQEYWTLPYWKGQYLVVRVDRPVASEAAARKIEIWFFFFFYDFSTSL